ncbi:MAG: FKBP-type peptidyl-prolyl cis-trans isomerase [bacterium]
MKKIISTIIILVVISFGFYFLSKLPEDNEVNEINFNAEQESEQTSENTGNIDGLSIEILQQGVGQETKNNDNITVHYTGTLEDRTKFDSSLDRGEPFSFVLGSGYVIKGWDLGLLGMKVGEKRKLVILPELGYGEAGAGGGLIPANATLVFEVELLSIN